VGKRIKHTTLKHCTKLLREYDAHLAERAEEFADDQMAYDAAAEELIEKINEARAQAVELDDRQRRVELAENAAERRSAELDQRSAELGQMRVAVDKQAEEIHRQKAEVDQEARTVEINRTDLNRREALLANCLTGLDQQKNQIDADKAANARQAQENSTLAGQLSIIEGIETKRLAVKWPKEALLP
jgi:hypothetical protein